MKRMLWLLFSLLLISSVAMADHIGVYSDATGTSCNLGPAGQFNPNATVIHHFATGATGSTFGVTFPAGTALFAFNSPYSICGVAGCEPYSLGYGQCLTGSIVLGSFLAIYGPGTVTVVPADGYLDIIYLDCSFAPHSATGGKAYVGISGDCYLPVKPSTWGSVKSLYR